MTTVLTLEMSTSFWATLIKLVKFLKRGKAPGPNNIYKEVITIGTTTSLYHHIARLFTSYIKLGYIPTA